MNGSQSHHTGIETNISIRLNGCQAPNRTILELKLENFLFTGFFNQLMEGETLTTGGYTYRISSLENDEIGKLKNVFAWKYPTEYQLKSLN